MKWENQEVTVHVCYLDIEVQTKESAGKLKVVVALGERVGEV